MFILKLIALIYQLFGWSRSDTVSGGYCSGGDVYSIRLYTPTLQDIRDYQKTYGKIYTKIPCYFCSKEIEFRIRLNRDIKTIYVGDDEDRQGEVSYLDVRDSGTETIY